jgi:hypothetical protein
MSFEQAGEELFMLPIQRLDQNCLKVGPNPRALELRVQFQVDVARRRISDAEPVEYRG